MKKNLFLVLVLSIAFIGSVIAQERTITGTVTSAEDGTTLPGVNVVVQGTNIGTVTNMDGKYSINVPADAEALEFSFVGMMNKTVPIGSSSVIDVALESGFEAMDEVVVTALGISREKKALGYAITEVGGEELATVKETNVINSLAGRVAGVVLTQSPSGPGGGTRVVIRGNNSITGNNQPLYVVDGIPMDNSGFGSADGTGKSNYRRDDYGTGVSDLNPDDIESMTVLKGPNAAALYGARAANGVILITTKKGRSTKGMGVTFTHSSTFETPLLLPEYQNQYGQGTSGYYYDGSPSFELTDLLNSGGSWGGKFDGQDYLYWTGETKAYKAQPDNVKDFFRTGSNMVNTIAFDGGTANSSLRFSYTNDVAKSILPNAGLTRHNFNVRGTTNLTDKLSVDAKVTYFVQESENRPFHGTEGIMAYVYDIPRNVDINDLKDYQWPDYSVRTYTTPGGSNGNPYWILYNDVNNDTRNRLLGFAKVNYTITDWLSAFVRIGTDFTSQKIETIQQYGHHYYKTGQFNFRNYKTTETNTDFLLMFDKEITSDIKITGNFGGNLMYQTYEQMGVFGKDFKIPTKPTTDSARELDPSYTPLREKKINSLYGSASLSYGNFVYLDVSGRNDWSSTLPEDNWSYFYPSVSLSVLLNEFIDPGANFMNFLKVRGSWAKVGSDTGPYQLDIAYDMQQDGYLGLITLTRPAIKLNPDLKPEQTASLEFGLEARFLDNRLFVDFSYYNIKTTDLIMDVPVSASTGYSNFRENVGEVENKGVEIMIGGTPYSAGDFSWDISANFSTNKNTLNDLIEGLESFTFSETNAGDVDVRATVGAGYGDIWGTTWMKNDAGQLVVNSDGIPQVDMTKKKLGNYQPDWIGGITNNFRYKTVSLNVLLDARIGGQVYSGTDAGLDASGVTKRTLKYREEGVIVDAVENTGTDESPVWEPNTMQITGQEYWGAYSGIVEHYVYDQTNVMLRELSLTYQLPSNLFNNVFIESVSLSLVGRNLAFLYKDKDVVNFDPTTSYSTSNYAQGVVFYTLPTTRSYGITLNVKF